MSTSEGQHHRWDGFKRKRERQDVDVWTCTKERSWEYGRNNAEDGTARKEETVKA